jgi:hypothetical protein
MAKYSSADLLNNELSMIGASDFMGRIIQKMNRNSSVLLIIKVPKNLYLRAEIFCEDIEELSGMSFIQNDLMKLLYEDFLIYAKRNPDPVTLLGLLDSIERSGNNNRELFQKGDNVFTLVESEKNQEMYELHVRMRRKSALRGEILLADMDVVHPDHGYTLERVMELLYIDFIEKFRKGNGTDALNKIINLLDE